MDFNTLIGTIGGFLYDNILLYALVIIGLYFTIRLRGVQFRRFGESLKVVTEKTDDKEAISSFEALMVSTASRVGTGNIVGVSTALCIGGFGSVFWMWLIAIVGSASAFVESTLAQIFKRKENDHDATCKGGPAYYIEQGLGSRGLGVLFSILLLCTFGCGFIMLASFNLVDSFAIYFGGQEQFSQTMIPIIIGAVTTAMFAYSVFGGSKKLSKITGILVPVMGVIYIVMAVLMIVLHANLLPAIIGRIFKEAFDFKAIMGGFSGSCLMYGVKRGLFSNEAGLGSAPNAAAAAEVSHPVKQGLVQILSVFLDTIIICSATAFMCMSSGVEPSSDLAGIAYVQEALGATFGTAGYVFITVAMVLFAFSTLLGNCFYAEPNLSFVLNHDMTKKERFIFYICETIFVFIGAFMKFEMVWNLADMMMAVMACVNLPVILILGKHAFACLKDYEKQRAEGKNPVFKAEDIGIKGTDFWN